MPPHPPDVRTPQDRCHKAILGKSSIQASCSDFNLPAWDSCSHKPLNHPSRRQQQQQQTSAPQAPVPTPPPANPASSQEALAPQSATESHASPDQQRQPPRQQQQQSQPLSVRDLASQFLPPDDPDFVPAPPEEFAPLSVCRPSPPLVLWGEEDSSTVSVKPGL